MQNMDVWQIVLFAVATYVAVTVLVRLMASRRTNVMNELRLKIIAQRRQKLAAERRKKAEQADEAA